MGRELTFVIDSPVPAQLPSASQPASVAANANSSSTIAMNAMANKPGSRKKSASDSVEPAPGRRQSSRATKGQGSAASQLQRAGEKVQEPAVRRTERFQVLEPSVAAGEPPVVDNPMAPAKMLSTPTVSRPQPRRVHKGSKSASEASEPFVLSHRMVHGQQPSPPVTVSTPVAPSQSRSHSRSGGGDENGNASDRDSTSDGTGDNGKEGESGDDGTSGDESDSVQSSADEHQVRVTLQPSVVDPVVVSEDALSCFKVSSKSASVVEQHWKKNRRPKAPSAGKLQRLKQQSLPRSQKTSSAHGNDKSPSDSDVEVSDARKRRKHRDPASKTPSKRQRNAPTHNGSNGNNSDDNGNNNNDSQLWKEVIAMAKSRAHLFLLTEDAFPAYDQYMAEAADCIYEACVVLQEQGIVPPIQCEADHSKVEQIPFKYVEKVYGNQSTFRGDVKRHAAIFIENLIISETAKIDDGPQCWKKVREAVAKLNRKFAFLHLIDSEGRRVRFGGPWVQQLCTTYLFKDDKDIGNLYPDRFQDGVPIETVAFFGTVMQNILDEWKTGKFIQHKFFAADYKKVYKKILRRACKADAHPVRGPAFRRLRQSWAQFDSGSSDESDAGSEVLSFCAHEFRSTFLDLLAPPSTRMIIPGGFMPGIGLSTHGAVFSCLNYRRSFRIVRSFRIYYIDGYGNNSGFIVYYWCASPNMGFPQHSKALIGPSQDLERIRARTQRTLSSKCGKRLASTLEQRPSAPKLGRVLQIELFMPTQLQFLCAVTAPTTEGLGFESRYSRSASATLSQISKLNRLLYVIPCTALLHEVHLATVTLSYSQSDLKSDYVPYVTPRCGFHYMKLRIAGILQTGNIFGIEKIIRVRSVTAPKYNVAVHIVHYHMTSVWHSDNVVVCRGIAQPPHNLAFTKSPQRQACAVGKDRSNAGVPGAHAKLRCGAELLHVMPTPKTIF
ncbi:hypothetical protein DENSPDRAFT_855490 [Dentipellis sp. KUC8613]|nr:hypothetical protein DENSPDRAFT_855490 [Dentipellis sp. KUC8613]